MAGRFSNSFSWFLFFVCQVKKDRGFSLPRTILEIDLKLDDKTELTLGKALLFTDFYPKYYYGDLIKFSGKLSEVESFSDFDYKSYLVRQGIVGTSFNPKIEFIKSSQGNFWIRQIYKFKSRTGKSTDKPYESRAQKEYGDSKEARPSKFKSKSENDSSKKYTSRTGRTIDSNKVKWIQQ